MRTAIRLSGAVATGAILTAAWLSAYCRNSEGALNGLFAAALAAAAVTLTIAWTAATPWAPAGRWLALALTGQAAALQLIDAGIRIHYQHYRLPAAALGDPVGRWVLLAVGLQTVLVAAGLLRHGNAILAWCRKGHRLALLVAAIAATGCVAAAVSRDPRYYAAEVTLGAFLQLVSACNFLLAAWSLPAVGLKTLSPRFDSLLGERGLPGPRAVDRFALMAALWVTVTSALLAWFVYQRHPHLADEVTYLFHARYLAAGRLTLPPPPVVPAFQLDLTEVQPDQWYVVSPVGWPAVLALGVALGIPWLVNPVLAGLNILLSYLFLGELYPRRIVRIATLLLCLSPWHIFMAMSYMNHTLIMTCTLLAFLGVARARRTGLSRWAWAAGLGVGVGSLIRPLEGLIVGVLAGAWALGLGGRRLKFPALAGLAAAAALAGALVLPYNKMLMGDPTASPMVRYGDKHYGHNSTSYGFGRDRGVGWPTDAYPGHTPFESLINAELNGSSLNVELFGWSTGSLALMALLIFSRGLRRPDFLMLAAIVGVVTAYLPYWGNGGGDFGARYWYLMLLPCAALTARGLDRLETALGPNGHNDARATATVAALCALALVNYFPWRSLDKYDHYLRMSPEVRNLARVHDFGRSLVLVRGEAFPDYASAAVYNPVDLQADAPIYAWDRDPAVRAELLRTYADRPVWVVEGPTITHAGYRIAAGPLNARGLGSESRAEERLY